MPVGFSIGIYSTIFLAGAILLNYEKLHLAHCTLSFS